MFIYYLIQKKKDILGLNKSYIYIVKKYKLSMNKNSTLTLSRILVFINAFIISIPMYIGLFFKINYFLLLIIAFIIFILLMLIIYNILGYILKKVGF